MPKKDWISFFDRGWHVSKHMQLLRDWLNTTSGYYLTEEGNTHTAEITFIFVSFQVSFMAYLPESYQCSIMVFAISIITYNQDVISNTKYTG